MLGKSRVRFSILAACVFLGGAAHAQSKPSFDCEKATEVSQKIICGNAELAALDARLATVFSARRSELDTYGQAALGRNQKAWVEDRAKSCAPPAVKDDIESRTACIREAYQDRLSALSGVCETGDNTVVEMAESKTPWSQKLPSGYTSKPDVQVYRNTAFVMNYTLPTEEFIIAVSGGIGMPCCGGERLMMCSARAPSGTAWLVSTDGKILYYALAKDMEAASSYDARVAAQQRKPNSKGIQERGKK